MALVITSHGFTFHITGCNVYLIILFRGDFFERVLKMEFAFFNYTKKFIQS